MISEARYRNPKFFLTNRLDLYQRTGKIFTARSYHHCNTSKLWVEHKPTPTREKVNDFGWFWRIFGSCSRCARHAAHRVSSVVVMLVVFITIWHLSESGIFLDQSIGIDPRDWENFNRSVVLPREDLQILGGT